MIYTFDIKSNKYSGDKALSSLQKYKKNYLSRSIPEDCDIIPDFPHGPEASIYLFEKLSPQIQGKVDIEKCSQNSMLLGLSISRKTCLVF